MSTLPMVLVSVIESNTHKLHVSDNAIIQQRYQFITSPGATTETHAMICDEVDTKSQGIELIVTIDRNKDEIIT